MDVDAGLLVIESFESFCELFEALKFLGRAFSEALKLLFKRNF
jgi:hypothetical protein